MNSQTNWYATWFNEDYLKLYTSRDSQEAQQQVEFLVSAMQLNPTESILDLACGTGRHSLILAKKGFVVTGLDLSEKLLSIAKRNLAQEKASLKLTYIYADMREYPQLGCFNVIINLFTSFGYFQDDIENQRVLKEARAHLNSAGKFFIDFLDPDDVKEHLIAFEEREVDHQVVTIQRKIDNQTIVKTIQFPHHTYEERVKLYPKATLINFLQAAGFTIEQYWDSYPYDLNGKKRQLFYCRAI